MSESLIQRGRRLQAAIQSCGGPPPDRVREYESAIAALDEAEAGTLGFFPLVFAAVAALAAIATTGYVAYKVVPTATEEVQEAIRNVRKIAVGGLAVWLALALFRDAKRRAA